MVATNAPRPGNVTPRQPEPEESEHGFDDPATLSIQELLAVRRRQRDPSPSEIAAACAEIQAGWTWQERRMRAGARPLSDAQRKRGDREFERYGNVTGWTPPTCRMLAGMGVTL